ncbi:MAG: hypothetical protein K0V04_07965 [Deltaproteobacteria bacterium]|nr:hypothetical protein [Deltaproteobacteria bacterium]
MTDDPTSTASIGYAWARMQRALETVRQHADPSVRARARAKLDRWQAVIEGMASGDLSVGRRAPVAETPAWVTLEVMHGGFATGNYLAEGPLLPHESERLATLDPQPSESTPRAQLNRWFLGDEGQGVLSEAIAARRIDVKLPEEGALAVVAWLTEHGYPAEALELTATLQPLMHRLRFYPPLTDKPRPRGSTVTLQTAAEAAVEVRRVQPQPSVETMNEALRVWNPLCDRLVALWSSTVDGALPHLERDDSGQLARGRNGQPIVAGSWPCRRWPDDWAALREAWLADYTRATKAHRRCRKHAHPRSNFARLRNALKRCPTNSQALDGRAVGWIRRALANTSSRRGAPGSKRRTALRQEQARAAARPSFVAFAQVVATRLDTAEPGRGLAGLDIVDRPIQPNEHPALPPASRFHATWSPRPSARSRLRSRNSYSAA